MSKSALPHYELTEHVREHCLCLQAQRAARTLARRFDAAFRPFGLTNGQFSLLMALNRPMPPTVGAVAALLAMDRTTLTAAVKPLERRGLLALASDDRDRRSRRLSLTPEGVALLAAAVEAWRSAHAELDAAIGPAAAAGAAALRALSGLLQPGPAARGAPEA